MRMEIHTHTRAQTYTHTRKHTHKHAHTHIHMHVDTHIHTYTSTHTDAHTHTKEFDRCRGIGAMTWWAVMEDVTPDPRRGEGSSSGGDKGTRTGLQTRSLTAR